MTILIAEDEPDIRAMLGDYLTGEGYDVMEAATGREAVVRAGQGPDLILLDVGLPDMRSHAGGWRRCSPSRRRRITARTATACRGCWPAARAGNGRARDGTSARSSSQSCCFAQGRRCPSRRR